MTDTLSLAAAHAADRRQSASVSPVPPYLHHAHTAPAFVEKATEEDDGEIACICAYNDDDGNTIQCDKCLRWQHIVCYYPPPKEVPGEDQKHYCIDCVDQPDLDARKATERQRRYQEERVALNGVKRPAPPKTTHKKKAKGSPLLPAQVNGWPSERHPHIHNHDRKSASPRDLPPPAKRPKTAHRSSGSMSQGRKRAGTVGMQRSPSKSPEFEGGIVVPHYSEEFINLFQPHSPQVDTDTNLMNNIAVTNSLSQWLTDSDAVSKATGGLAPSEIFKRWDGRIEDIPGRPEVSVQWVEDPRFTQDDTTPRWAQLTVDQDIAPGTFIGELRGRIGQRDDYMHDPDGSFHELQHPEPFVFFHQQLPIVVDARQEGSLFRYVRRSCQPNAELQTIITEGTEYHFCFMATKDIMAGDEVTVAWQIPDIVREKISSSLAQSNNFESNVKYYIARWVSKVLANCGPCACNGQINCLMAHYDYRGRSLPPDPVRKKGRKRKIPQLDTAVTSRSRSASEVHKLEQEEDATDSRSVSGSRGSVSRDITPSTHYSANTVIPEMSERERKKLMREEEMFKRQEEEYGKQKKKRNSGGSNLNTPSTATSKQLGFPPNAKYADAGTSVSRNAILPPRQINGKRKAAPGPRVPRKESSGVVRKPKPVYVDVAIQCDLDQKAELPARPRRRYVSVTQKLLQRCISNNFKHKPQKQQERPVSQPVKEATIDLVATSTAKPSLVPDVAPVDDAMELDDVAKETSPPIVATAAGFETIASSPVLEPAVVTMPTKDPEVVDQAQDDTVMTETAPESPFKPESPVMSSKTLEPPTSPSLPEDPALSSHPPMDPPPPPWPQTSSSPRKDDSPTVASEPAHEIKPPPQHHKPVMHVDMPPPPTNPFGFPPSLTPQTSASQVVQSPPALTPSASSLSVNPPIFSPNVTAAVAPSPARKKLSLSDYTRRSKARESTGEATALLPGSTSAVGDKDTESATADLSTADKVAEVVERAKEAAGRSTDTETQEKAKDAIQANESAVIDEPVASTTAAPAAVMVPEPASLVDPAPVPTTAASDNTAPPASATENNNKEQ